MYRIGDFVVYGTSGVCRVVEIGTPKAARVDEKKVYYTLAPLFSTEIIHLPVDSEAFIRKAMTKAQAEALIAKIPSICEETIDIPNMQMLLEHYQAALQSHDCVELVHLIKALYKKDSNAQHRGKKLSVVDKRCQKRAEALLHGELSVALGIGLDEVPVYIRDRVSGSVSPLPVTLLATGS